MPSGVAAAVEPFRLVQRPKDLQDFPIAAVVVAARAKPRLHARPPGTKPCTQPLACQKNQYPRAPMAAPALCPSVPLPPHGPAPQSAETPVLAGSGVGP